MAAKHKQRRKFFDFTLNGKGTTLAEQLPNDIYAGLSLGFIGKGNLVAGFASGTPVAKYQSGFQSLIEKIEILRGNVAIKSMSPEMVMYDMLLLNKRRNQHRSTGSGTATDDPQTDTHLLVFGTDTQKINWREHLQIDFFFPYEKSEDKYRSCLRTTDKKRYVVALKQQPYSNILDAGNTTTVTYSADNLQISVSIIEFAGKGATEVPCDMDYLQEEITYVARSATDKNTVDVPQAGALASIVGLTRDGAAGSATTGTANQPNNKVISNFQLIKSVNGAQERLVDSDFDELQREMKSIHGYEAPKSSGKAIDDGLFGVFYNQKGYDDLVDISPESASSVKMKFTTTSTPSYTNYCEIKFLVSQLAYVK